MTPFAQLSSWSISMAATLKQIAELAGVSRGTVDRVLNNRGDVRKDVVERVNSIALKLDYKPNPLAKALVNSKNKYTIGVITNSGGNPFFNKVLSGIDMAKREISSFNVHIKSIELTGYDVIAQLNAINNLVSAKVHAIVITPINDKKIVSALNKIISDGIPVVTLNSDVTGVHKLAFVGCDYKKSGQTAAELLALITNKTANVAVITGSNMMLGHTKRVNGFKSVICEMYSDIHIIEVCEAFDNDEQAYKNTMRILKNFPQVDSLYFCAGGINGGIKAVTNMGLAHKLKIITVDDTDNIRQFMARGIVQITVCQQPKKQGYDAIKLVFDKLLHDKSPERIHMYTQNEIKTIYNL